MEIDKTINKWFEETENMLANIGSAKNTEVDKVCFSSISVVGNYLKNAIMILNHNSKLPAKALLRVLGEFIIKFVWCLQNSMRKQPALANERFERWRKHSLIKDQKFRKDILNAFDGSKRDEIQRWIEECDKEIKSVTSKSVPEFAQIIENVFGSRETKAYAGMYLRFLNAVHLDLRTLSDTIREDNFSSICEGDTDDSIDDLKVDCLICACIFFRELYRFYGLNFQKIEDEYQVILKSFIQ